MDGLVALELAGEQVGESCSACMDEGHAMGAAPSSASLDLLTSSNHPGDTSRVVHPAQLTPNPLISLANQAEMQETKPRS